MTRRPIAARDRLRAQLLVGVLVVAWVLDLVDAARPGARSPVATAAVFGFVVSALEFVWSWLGTVAEITATYLATVVSWIAKRLADLFLSTGAVFARVWDALKIVWSDVLKPALQWIDTWIKGIHKWLVDTFTPVFKFLKELRDRIQKFYDTFVRPVTDTIDFIRAVDNVLLQFHITFLDGLSRVLTDVERRIDQVYGTIISAITRVQNVLDRIVDGFGFFQRYTMVASLRKHLPHWTSFFWADQIGPRRPATSTSSPDAEYPDHDLEKDIVVMTEYFASDSGDAAPSIDELATILQQILDGATPIEPADAA